MFINGARCLYNLSRAKDVKAKSLVWIKGICERAHTNVAVVAMANKLARTAWAIVVHEREYDSNFISKPPVFVKKAA